LKTIKITADGQNELHVYRTEAVEGERRLKSVLKKKSNRERLAENFIRPYAICWTPKFLARGRATSW
jgi:hypothetical protein